MGKEIERKFLVKSTSYRSLSQGTYYRQGYIPTLNGMTVRARIAGDKGYLTLKDHAIGLTRHEFEYEVPLDEARQILELMCDKPQIEKHRYVISAGIGTLANGDIVDGLHWEVDEFHGDNEGLIVAEIEVPEEDCSFELPEWIDKEVTGDHRYYNSHLSKFPYSKWQKNETGKDV